MNKYQNGKIYKITSKQTDDVYIGSTCKPLNTRMTHHKVFKEYVSSTRIIKYGDAIIELIEKYPCKTRDELLWRERYWIENTKCVNVYRPIITYDEKIKYKKDFRYKHKNKCNEYAKNHYIKNKEKKLKECKLKYQFQSSHFGQLCRMF